MFLIFCSSAGGKGELLGGGGCRSVSVSDKSDFFEGPDSASSSLFLKE